MAKIQMLLLTLVVFLSACGTNTPQDVSSLPTVAQLPTVTPTLPETATPTALPVTEGPTSTDTITPSVTVSLTSTVTPSATITETPTPTATNTPLPTDTAVPTADNEALLSLVQLAAQATVLPQLVTTNVSGIQATLPVVVVTQPNLSSCSYPPSGGFATVFASDVTLRQQMGCPVGAPPTILSYSSASELFERGEMFWVQGPPSYIYSLFNTGRFQRYDDSYNSATDPVSGGETPPQNLKEPVRGFGKIWRTFTEVRNGLGWAFNDETGGQATVQLFERGQMLYLSQRSLIFILIYDDPVGIIGSWRSVPGTF